MSDESHGEDVEVRKGDIFKCMSDDLTEYLQLTEEHLMVDRLKLSLSFISLKSSYGLAVNAL